MKGLDFGGVREEAGVEFVDCLGREGRVERGGTRRRGAGGVGREREEELRVRSGLGGAGGRPSGGDPARAEPWP